VVVDERRDEVARRVTERRGVGRHVASRLLLLDPYDTGVADRERRDRDDLDPVAGRRFGDVAQRPLQQLRVKRR